MHVYVCMCMYVCMYVCMYTRMPTFIDNRAEVGPARARRDEGHPLQVQVLADTQLPGVHFQYSIASIPVHRSIIQMMMMMMMLYM